ncbi:MAG: polysaccharide deacetylase family protein [Bacteroidetes bacterium]|nr:polysaccharide deacetylase family protein [Bacteroidota bacterium]
MPKLIWQVPNEENKIFLTFDDGPTPRVTDWVLETLELLQIPATFFVVGENVEKHPKVFEQIIAKGHSVGNHTFNHLNSWKTSQEDYLLNIKKCADVIGDTTGIPMFRPPYGKISLSLSNKILKMYRIVMWDVLSYDFDLEVPVEKCLAKSTEYTRAGSIVIFHDSFKTEARLKTVLPAYFKKMVDEGFTFCRL